MDIRVPQLAEGINSGTVVSVLVSPGDKIKKEQTLIELETEKAVAPIPASAEGTISKIHVSEGDSVNVGQIIITLTDAKKGSSEEEKSTPIVERVSVPQQISARPVAMPSVGYVSPSGAPAPASPSVRKIARELGIDLYRVQGTENGGRITIHDVRNYITALQTGAFTPVGTVAVPVKSAAVSVDFSKWGSIKKESMTMLRKKIAEKMTESWTTIPHVTQYDDVDITDLLALRKKHVASYEKSGARLTVTSFVYKAVANVLKEWPVFNASMDETTQEIVYKSYYHIGLAVDTEQGLIVPVIRDVDKKDLFQISQDIAVLSQKTRDRKVAIEDMQGGTFTISNQGGIGGDHFTPIINKPEVAILGVGQASLKPVVVDNKIAVRMIMPIAVSYDHRLIDGGKAARFITDLVKALEGFVDKDVKISNQSQKDSKSSAKAKKKGKR